jgi:hypothetical protein
LQFQTSSVLRGFEYGVSPISLTLIHFSNPAKGKIISPRTAKFGGVVPLILKEWNE